MRSDPTSRETPGAPFDGDGLPLTPTTWIDRGTLSALAYSRFWAQKRERTPNGRHTSFHLAGGSADGPEQLIAGVKRGLLITRFWYTRWVDPQSMLTTGLTRDGVFLIEGGKLTGAVNNFRFNESPAVVLKNVDALTRETYRTPVARGAIRVPFLRTHEFNLASSSAAV